MADPRTRKSGMDVVAKLSVVDAFHAIRREGFEVSDAVARLGESHVIHDAREYKSLQGRARVYESALLHAAAVLATKCDLDIESLTHDDPASNSEAGQNAEKPPAS